MVRNRPYLDEARVFPIPLREDLIVRILDLPADLTLAEAEKLGRVLAAMADVGLLDHARKEEG